MAKERAERKGKGKRQRKEKKRKEKWTDKGKSKSNCVKGKVDGGLNRSVGTVDTVGNGDTRTLSVPTAKKTTDGTWSNGVQTASTDPRSCMSQRVQAVNVLLSCNLPGGRQLKMLSKIGLKNGVAIGRETGRKTGMTTGGGLFQRSNRMNGTMMRVPLSGVWCRSKQQSNE